MSVSALAEPFQVSLPAISKQLRVLERAGLVVQEKDGRIRLCHLQTGPMERAAQWMEQYRRFWDGQLESLSSYIEDAELEEHPPGTATGNPHQQHEETNTP